MTTRPFVPFKMAQLCGIALLVLMTSPLNAQVLQDHHWTPDGPVNAVAVDDQTGTLFLGGDFRYCGPNQDHSAEVGRTTGELHPAIPRANNEVRVSAPDGAGGWFIGGTFTTTGGVARQCIARINANGSVHPFSATFGPPNSSSVEAIVVKGDTVFIGGSFAGINGGARNNFGAFNKNTGALLNINPNLNNDVLALDLHNGIIYLGGDFNTVGTQARSRCAALNASTGALTTWNPNVSSTVRSLAASDDAVFIGGEFSQVGSQSRPLLAKVDANTGALQPWQPFPTGLEVTELELVGSTLYVGGTFSIIGAEFRDGLAALDVNSALANAWAPVTDDVVYALVHDGTEILLGGAFLSVNGATRRRVAAVDATTGATGPWDPNATGNVLSLAVQSDRVHVGGQFKSIGGVDRNNAVAIDLNTGRATDWDPAPNAAVQDLAVHDGDVYIGGAFTSVAGESRQHIAAVDVTGALLTWAPQANDTVHKLVLDSDQLYTAGSFSSINGSTRQRIARFDLASGALDPWAPAANGRVMAVAVADQTVYLGGDFSTINATTRSRLAAVDRSTGSTTPWDPGTSGTVRTIVPFNDLVYIGGSFIAFSGNTGGQPRERVACVSASTGLATPWNPSASNTVRQIVAWQDSVLIGGDFGFSGGLLRTGLCWVNTSTGAATAYQLEITSSTSGGLVRDILFNGAFLHAGGGFSYVLGNTSTGIRRTYSATFNMNRITLPDAGALNPCQGSTFTTSITATGPFGPGNVFSVELSDASGSFSAPTTIGTSTGGSVTCTIPVTVPASTGYRLRVLSSDPAQIGTASASFEIEQADAWFADVDEDGFGDPAADSLSCFPPIGYVSNGSDCDDTDDSVFFGALCDDGDPATTGENWTVDCTCGDAVYNGQDLSLTLMQDWWMTNGPVHAIATDSINDRVFIGGEFDLLVPEFPLRPFGGQVNFSNAAPDAFPEPNGIIHATLADGTNGWFIAGEFTEVGGQVRNRIARLNSDGTLNPWSVNVNGPVHALLLVGTTLYIGGDFTMVGTLVRTDAAAVSATTGAVLSWAPTTDGAVLQMVTSNNNIYLRGTFDVVNGQSRSSLASVSTAGVGTLQAWNPSVDGGIWSIATNQEAVYIGGILFTVNGVVRDNLAAVDPISGGLFSWAPTPGDYVADIVLNGTRLIAGGSFTGGVKAFDAFGEGAQLWSANITGVDRVFSVGGAIVVSGFSPIAGQNTRHVAKLTASNGSLNTWDPAISGPINAAALSNNGLKVYLGGDFDILGGTRRINLASLDLNTGSPLPWNPVPDDRVSALCVHQEHVIAGGRFTEVNGTDHVGIARIDGSSGAVASFAGSDGEVRSLTLGDGSLYVGGAFSTMGGQPRNNLAALDPVTGAATSWASSTDLPVNAISHAADGLFVGGDFSFVGLVQRRRIAKVDLNTGVVTTWNAGLGSNAPDVRSITLKGDELYAGTGSSLIKLDRTTGAGIPDVVVPNDAVNATLYIDGSLFVGGAFSQLTSGAQRSRMALLRLTYDQYHPFDPLMDNDVLALASNAGMVFSGGAFTEVQGVPRPHFAVFAGPDCFGVPGGPAQPGTSCDDNNPNTGNDAWTSSCTCEGELITTVVDPQDLGADLTLWPNPAHDLLYSSETLDGMILDIHGRSIARVQNQSTIDISELAPGAYVIHTSSGLTIRFVKN